MTDADLFGSLPDQSYEFDPEKNYVEELVGEGKKFSDPNKLAYGKIESDRFISRLQQENETLREDLLARQRLEEIVTKLTPQAQNNQSTSNDDNHNRQRDVDDRPPAGLTPEQAEQLVEQKLRERTNFERSLSGVKKVFGENYQHKLDSEAKKLGLSKEFVNQLAKTNPDAFVRMFQGTVVQQQNDILQPSNSVNSEAFRPNTSSEKTAKYYKELKKSNPALYNSKEVQLQEYRDAMRLGEKFFDA